MSARPEDTDKRPADEQRRSIAPRLAFAALAVSLVLAVMVSALQLYFSYRDNIASVMTRFALIETGYLPSLQGALWEVDERGVNDLLSAIASLPDVGSVELVDEVNVVTRRNNHLGETSLAQRDYVLRQPGDAEQREIGRLRIELVNTGIFARLKTQVWQVTITALCVLLGNSLLVLMLFRRWVSRHLEKLAHFADDFDVEKIDTALTLERSSRHEIDELDLVVRSLNDMREIIRNELDRKNEIERELRMHRDELERLIDERTAAYRTSVKQLEVAASVAKLGVFNRIVGSDRPSWNERMFEIYELPRESSSLSFDDWKKYLHPEDADRVIEGLSKAVSSSNEYDVTFRIITGQGNLRHIHSRAQMLCDATGKTISITGINRDITDEVELRAKLTDALEAAGAILNTAQTPIITLDAAGTIRVINSAGERDFGYRAADVVGQCIELLIPESGSTECGQFSQRYLRSDILQKANSRTNDRGYEVLAKRKDGSNFPAQMTIGAMDIAGEPMFVCVLIDLTELQRQRNELVAARDQMAMAAEVAELGVWDWNIRASTLHWNERMFEIYNLPPSADQQMDFERWREFIHIDDATAARTAMQTALDDCSIYAVNFRIVIAGGSVRYVQARGYVVCDIDGKPMRVIGINRDVTGQMELQTRLTLAKEQADAASAAKSAFLANMSHEIRTPMNAVLGMLQLVQRTGLDTRQRDYISKAHSAAISLLDLLNDILDYSKIEAGKLDLDVHSFELETLMNNLAAVLSGNQQKKEVEVIFDVAPTLPAILIGDSLRLQQVLINLAGNALKFTEQGHVDVSITELSRDEENIHLRVAVTDTGIGISPEQQSRLFDAFTQAETSTTRRFGGTGLGLAISQRLVAMMGSTLRIDSALGRGSRFWFDLTLHIAPQTQSLKSVYRSLANLRVLVVDDNALTCEILVRTMQGLDWVADCVHSGNQAVRQVEQAAQRGEPYDVIFMDLRLADIDGINAATQIRNMSVGANQSPRIIMITAYGRDELAEIQLGPNPPFVDFLTKPVSTLQLVTVVQRALVETPASMQEIVEVERPPQLVGLRVLVVEDNAMNRQIANELLSGEGAQVELAEGGLEGVHKVLSARQCFDVVIMDLQMPDIDGLEATRRIRADARFRDLPILAMTANVSEADRLQCLAAGMDEHIGKPIDLDELVLSLMAILRDRPTQPAFQQFTENAERPIAETEELTSILRRFGGKPALFRTMLTQFRGDADRMFNELQELVAQSDWLGVDRILHTLKGNAATMGAQAMSRRIAVLERDLKTAHETEKKALLDVPVIADCRQQLFAVIDTLEALCGEHNSIAAQSDSRTAIAPLAPEQWRFKLTEILVLLEASNLQAIEQVEALAPVTPPDQQAQFGRLFAQVQALEFASAIITAQTLLQGK